MNDSSSLLTIEVGEGDIRKCCILYDLFQIKGVTQFAVLKLIKVSGQNDTGT